MSGCDNKIQFSYAILQRAQTSKPEINWENMRQLFKLRFPSQSRAWFSMDIIYPGKRFPNIPRLSLF